MLGPGGFVTLEGVREGMPYLEAFDAVASLLANLRLITSDEASLLRDRERAGERLNTAGVALPHAVTPVKSPTFRLVVVRPSAPVMDGDERIELVLVVLASKGQLDKSSVFPYLVSRIGAARSRGDELPTDLDSAIRFLGGRPGRFA